MPKRPIAVTILDQLLLCGGTSSSLSNGGGVGAINLVSSVVLQIISPRSVASGGGQSDGYRTELGSGGSSRESSIALIEGEEMKLEIQSTSQFGGLSGALVRRV